MSAGNFSIQWERGGPPRQDGSTKPKGRWNSHAAEQELDKDTAMVGKNSTSKLGYACEYVNARGPFAEIVEAVYDCRSARLSSGFGCTNNSHSSNANKDVGAPTELGYPASN